ncbi:DUF4194 domain-containing protein [Nocardioides zeae]|uniref:DUF4194 domain-containing protein n=1 Tax=Nocardioides zeae TaxID=1457234 RepID=A0A6P0HKA6_9ACTN|nr:DUF4194 domain-containing protein [Nocardioides zeae]NEN78075.1 DUF4194 domain-containing protein [Nocardioides zeae]
MTERTAESEPGGLWTGDRGRLHEQSRRALLELLKGPYLSGRQRPQLWVALIADEAAIRSRLHDVFLELVLDPVDEFAFTRKVRTTELDVPSPLRTETLTFLDTAMLLVLRQQVLAAPGEARVIVGQDEVYERLDVYRTGDASTYLRNLNGAWGRMMNKLRVIHAAGEGRAEISPVVKFLLDHDHVVALTAEYRRIAGAEPAVTDPADEEES